MASNRYSEVTFEAVGAWRCSLRSSFLASCGLCDGAQKWMGGQNRLRGIGIVDGWMQKDCLPQLRTSSKEIGTHIEAFPGRSLGGFHPRLRQLVLGQSLRNHLREVLQCNERYRIMLSQREESSRYLRPLHLAHLNG